MAGFDNDSRVVMTLDAGGTNFRFSAMHGSKPIPIGMLKSIIEGSGLSVEEFSALL